MSECDVMLTVKVTLKSHVYQVSTNDDSEVIKQTQGGFYWINKQEVLGEHK